MRIFDPENDTVKMYRDALADTINLEWRPTNIGQSVCSAVNCPLTVLFPFCEPDLISMPDPLPSPSAAVAPLSTTIRRVSLVILIVAAALRLPGLWTDFWMDEIWSWFLIWEYNGKARVNGIEGILTGIHHDNNNYLHTMYLYLCGPEASVVVYRLPAFFAGLTIVWLGRVLVARWTQLRDSRDVLAVLFGMGLLATSEVEVIYSSEARGYALAGCAALGAQWALGRWLQTNRWPAVLGYALFACAGFLSHLSFLPVFLAQAVWGVAAVFWSRELASSRYRLMGKLLLAFGIPALMVGWLWVVDLSRIKSGGGPQLSPWSVTSSTLAMPFGISLPEEYNLPLALMFAVLLVLGLWSLRRAPMLEIVALISLIVIAPTVMFGMAPKGLVYPRHFLVSLTVLIPAAGVGLAHLLTADWRGLRLAGVLIIAAWCGGNGSELIRFWSAGRGQYEAALEHISASSPDPQIRVGSDFDFRNGLVLGFYQVRVPAYQRITYVPQNYWSQIQPDWFLIQDFNRISQLPPEAQVQGRTYVLESVYPFAGPVGWRWGAYKLQPEKSL